MPESVTAPLPRIVVGQPEVGVRLGWASRITLLAATAIGVLMVAWPLLVPVPEGSTQGATAPLLFALILPLIIAVVLAQISEGGMDTRTLAMLGVLSALNAVIRPALSAGTAGIEAVFFLLILAGRAYGAGFGFVLGCTSLLASALLTGGVGPYLPFQMMFAAWTGGGAGLLPRLRRSRRGAVPDPGPGRSGRLRDDRPRGDRLGGDRLRGDRLRSAGEVAMLAAYGIAAAYLFGALMNLWFWPFITGSPSPDGAPGGLDYIPGAPVTDNLQRFGVFTVLTSTAGWDTGRALTNAAFIAVLGAPILRVLRRAA